MHTETETVKQARDEYTDINVENPQCEKNYDSPQTAEYTMEEEYNSEDTQRQ